MTSLARVALLSDIHANLHALERVVRDIDALGVDAVACLGDVATLGPRPVEVIDVIRARARWFILGNHDEYLLDPALSNDHNRTPPIASAVAWCRSELRSEDHEFVRGFQARVDLDLGSGVRLLLFHGGPASNMQDILSDTPKEQLDAWLDGYDATVMAGGHTHVQMLRQHDGRLLLNPGSVGLPFRAFVNGGPPVVLPHAEYAVVETRGRDVAVALRRVELDGARLRDQTRAWREPLGEYLMAQYAGA
jgi:putative phosphoesterase